MKKRYTLFVTALAFVSISANAQTVNFIWAKQLGGTNDESGRSIGIDANGNVYTIGYFKGTADFDPGTGTYNLNSAGYEDIFISKIDVSGNFLWAKQLGGIGQDNGSSLTVDVNGNVYTTGQFQGTVDFDPGPGIYNLNSGGSGDVFVSNLDASGNFLWAKNMGGGTGTGALGYSIAVDANANVYITGRFSGTVDFDPGPGTYNLSSGGSGDVFVSKLDASGSFIWAKGGASGAIDYSIAIDANTNVYITGRFSGTVDFDPGPGTYYLTSAGGVDIFVSKFDASGNFIWAKGMGGTNANQEVGYSIAVDANGNVYTAGEFYGTADFDPGSGIYNLTSVGSSDIFISKLDASGNFIWAKGMGGVSSDRGYSIAVDVNGNVYSTGYFNNTVDFDPGDGINNLTSAGNYAIFVSKFDASGNFIWAKQLDGTSSSTVGPSFAVNAINNIYITGGFYGTVDFDPGPGIYNLTPNGERDIFVVKLSQGSPPPVITCPNNTTINLEPGQCFAQYEYAVGCSDNCGNPGATQQSGIPSGGQFPIGTTTNVFTCTDCANNQSVCTFTVTVLEYANPISSPICNDLTYFYVDGNCSVTVGADDILEGGPYGCLDDYTVELDKTPPSGNGPWVGPLLTCADIGKTYLVRITDPDNGNNCTGNIQVVSNVCSAAPSTQAKNISFTSFCANQMTLNWTNGNGTRRIVKINTSNSFTAPANGTDPTPNATYTGSGQQVVYNGNSNTFTVSGLSPNTTYWFRVYEANCIGSNSLYNTSTANQNPKSKSTSASMVLAFTTTPACAGSQNGTATVNVTGGTGGKNYLWNTIPPATTKKITGLAAATYMVTVTDGQGCTVVGMTTVPGNPTISATSQASPINDPPYSVTIYATGGTPPYMYRKQKPDGTYNNNYQTYNVFSNLAEGVYFFEVKDVVGCTFELSEAVGKAGDCPYPVIFIHGIDGDETSWNALYENSYFKNLWGEQVDVFHSVNNAYSYTDLDGPDDTTLGNINDDVLVSGSTLQSGCLYAVNMDNFWNKDTNNPQFIIHGDNDNDDESESNQSAILKSGYVIKKAIEKVLAANPTKKYVILAGHSMGGLGSREYLQRTANGMHRWWQHPTESDGHRVAKVFTVGTPHRGSNFFGNASKNENDSGNKLIPSPLSEATRDLRYNYELEEPDDENYQGLYLFGGNENMVVDNTHGFDFYNYDVDCDGDETSEGVVGLDEPGTPAWEGTEDNDAMPLPTNVRYTYYVGNKIHSITVNNVPIPVNPPYGIDGDVVVDDKRQWLYFGGNGSTIDFMNGNSKPRPIIGGVEYRLSDRFTSETSVYHAHLVGNLPFAELDDVKFLVRGLDEGDYPKYAWEIKKGIKYAGMTQIRPEKIPQGSEYTNSGDRDIDGDWFKVELTQNGKKIKITLNPNTKSSGRIDLYPSQPSDYSNTIAPPLYFKTFGVDQSLSVFITPVTMAPGTYFFRITHDLNSISGEGDRANAWRTPYKFKVTFPDGFSPGPDDREANEELIIGDIRPQPVTSEFNLDIFSPTDDLKVTFGLFNPIGQAVFERSETLAEGDNTLSFPSDDLPPGIYFLTVQAGTARKTLRVMKL